MAQPFHILCSTNAMHWRPRCSNDDIGWAVQRSDFNQMSWWSRFFDLATWAKHASLHCVVEQHLSSCKDLRQLYDSENNNWFCSPPSHVTFDVYFDCFGVWHHNLILMTCFCTTSFIFHCRMAEANAMIHYTRHHTRLVRLSSTFLLGFAAQHL